MIFITLILLTELIFITLILLTENVVYTTLRLFTRVLLVYYTSAQIFFSIFNGLPGQDKNFYAF